MLFPSPKEWETSCTYLVPQWSRCSKCCRSWLNRGKACTQSFETVSPFCRNLYFQTSKWSCCGSCQNAPARWTDLLTWVSLCSQGHLGLFESRDWFLKWIWSVLEGNQYTVLTREQQFFERNSLLRLSSFGKESKCGLWVSIRSQLPMKDLCPEDTCE